MLSRHSTKRIARPDKQPKKNIPKNKEVIKTMFVNGKQDCFITLKDHKPNFQNNPTVRLLNPAKNELSRISKTILEKINENLYDSLHLNQWKNTQEVIDWLKGIDNLLCLTSNIFTSQFRRNS